jgi:hypothetical protein
MEEEVAVVMAIPPATMAVAAVAAPLMQIRVKFPTSFMCRVSVLETGRLL